MGGYWAGRILCSACWMRLVNTIEFCIAALSQRRAAFSQARKGTVMMFTSAFKKRIIQRASVLVAASAVGFFAATIAKAATSEAEHGHGLTASAGHLLKGWGSCSKCACQRFMGHGDFCENCGHRFSWH